MEVQSLDFAALSISTSTNKQSDCMCQGWGSEETRKAYVCLEKLGNEVHNAKPIPSITRYVAGSATNFDKAPAYLNGDEDMDCDKSDCDDNFW